MIGIVVGLEAEARLARRLSGAIEVAVGGGTSDGARRAAERLLARGASGLLSLGLAAGLSPDLRPGTLIVARRVIIDGVAFTADHALSQLLGGLTPHDLLHSERVIATTLDKHRLFEATRCAVLDMESGAVARAALAEGRPFAVLRAVCDPASRSLPPAALVALAPGGGIEIGRLARSLAHRPAQLGALIRLARDAVAARRALIERIRTIRSLG